MFLPFSLAQLSFKAFFKSKHCFWRYKTLILLITFGQWVLELWYFTWVFLVIWPFRCSLFFNKYKSFHIPHEHFLWQDLLTGIKIFHLVTLPIFGIGHYGCKCVSQTHLVFFLSPLLSLSHENKFFRTFQWYNFIRRKNTRKTVCEFSKCHFRYHNFQHVSSCLYVEEIC